ncbi:MAG: hypothetical protein IPN20_12540 [Haliscomenobacter sp.]|nr:hypothetical protein [Haliscomenobacter sp.]
MTSSNPILQKIQSGHAVSEQEIEILADELHRENPHITIDLLRRVYNHRKAQFVQFIKHILGIRNFGGLSWSRLLRRSTNSLRNTIIYRGGNFWFLDLLRNFILEKGDLQKRHLIESPFTMIHPEGIRGIFSPKEINEILHLTEKLLAA